MGIEFGKKPYGEEDNAVGQTLSTPVASQEEPLFAQVPTSTELVQPEAAPQPEAPTPIENIGLVPMAMGVEGARLPTATENSQAAFGGALAGATGGLSQSVPAVVGYAVSAYNMAKDAWNATRAKIGPDSPVANKVLDAVEMQHHAVRTAAGTIFTTLGRFASVPDYALGGAAYAAVENAKELVEQDTSKNSFADNLVRSFRMTPLPVIIGGVTSAASALLWRSPEYMHSLADAMGEVGVPEDMWLTGVTSGAMKASVDAQNGLAYYANRLVYGEESADAWWESVGAVEGAEAAAAQRKTMESFGPAPREALGIALEMMLTGGAGIRKIAGDGASVLNKTVGKIPKIGEMIGDMATGIAKGLPDKDPTELWFKATGRTARGAAVMTLSAVGPDAMKAAYDHGGLIRKAADVLGLGADDYGKVVDLMIGPLKERRLVETSGFYSDSLMYPLRKVTQTMSDALHLAADKIPEATRVMMAEMAVSRMNVNKLEMSPPKVKALHAKLNEAALTEIKHLSDEAIAASKSPEEYIARMRTGDTYGVMETLINKHEAEFREAMAIAGTDVTEDAIDVLRAGIRTHMNTLTNVLTEQVQRVGRLEDMGNAVSKFDTFEHGMRAPAKVQAMTISEELAEEIFPRAENISKDLADLHEKHKSAGRVISAAASEQGAAQVDTFKRLKEGLKGTHTPEAVDMVLEKMAYGEIPPTAAAIIYKGIITPDIHLGVIAKIAMDDPQQAMGSLALAFDTLKGHLPVYLAQNPEFAKLVKTHLRSEDGALSLAKLLPGKYLSEQSSAAKFTAWNAAQPTPVSEGCCAIVSKLVSERKMDPRAAREIGMYVADKQAMLRQANAADDYMIDKLRLTDDIKDFKHKLKAAERIPTPAARRKELHMLHASISAKESELQFLRRAMSKKGFEHIVSIMDASESEKKLGRAINKVYRNSYEAKLAAGTRMAPRESLVGYRPRIMDPNMHAAVYGHMKTQAAEKFEQTISEYDKWFAHIAAGDYEAARAADTSGILDSLPDSALTDLHGDTGREAWTRLVGARAQQVNMDIEDILGKPFNEGELWTGDATQAAKLRVQLSFSEKSSAASDLGTSSFKRVLPEHYTIDDLNEMGKAGQFDFVPPDYKGNIFVDSPIDVLHMYEAETAAQLSGRRFHDVARDMAMDKDLPFIKLVKGDFVPEGQTAFERGARGYRPVPVASLHTDKEYMIVDTNNRFGKEVFDMMSAKQIDTEWHKRVKRVNTAHAALAADDGPQFASMTMLNDMRSAFAKSSIVKGIGKANERMLKMARKWLYLSPIGAKSWVTNFLDNTMTLAFHEVSSNSSWRGLSMIMDDFASGGDGAIRKVVGSAQKKLLSKYTDGYSIGNATLHTIDDATFLRNYKGTIIEQATGKPLSRKMLESGSKGVKVSVDLDMKSVQALRDAYGMRVAPWRELEMRQFSPDRTAFTIEEAATAEFEKVHPTTLGGKAGKALDVVEAGVDTALGVEAGSHVSDMVEKHGRNSMWLHYMEKGDTPAEALKKVNDAFIDYGTYSKVFLNDMPVIGDMLNMTGKIREVGIPGTKVGLPQMAAFGRHMGPFVTFNLYNVFRQARMLYDNPKPFLRLMHRVDQFDQKIGRGHNKFARDAAVLAHHTGSLLSPYSVSLGTRQVTANNPDGSKTSKPMLQAMSMDFLGPLEAVGYADAIAGPIWDKLVATVSQTHGHVTTNRKELTDIVAEKFAGLLGPAKRTAAEILMNRDFRTGRNIDQMGSPVDSILGSDDPQSLTYAPGVGGMVSKAAYKIATGATPLSRVILTGMRMSSRRAGYDLKDTDIFANLLLPGYHAVDLERMAMARQRYARQVSAGKIRNIRKAIGHATRYNYGSDEYTERLIKDMIPGLLQNNRNLGKIRDPDTGKVIEFADFVGTMTDRTEAR